MIYYNQNKIGKGDNMLTETEFNLYDSINTLGARWLTWNSKERKADLGIKGFNNHNKIHLWLLYLMKSYSIGNGYKDIYIDCPFYIYLWFKYVKKIKQLKYWRTNSNVFLIDPEIFTKELCDCFKKSPKIVEQIYDEYWRKKYGRNRNSGI